MCLVYEFQIDARNEKSVHSIRMNAEEFGTRSGHYYTRPLLVDHLLKAVI